MARYLPPWRSAMPGLLKFYVIFCAGWGLLALSSGVLGMDLTRPTIADHPGGRAALVVGGALGLATTVLTVVRRPPGLYCFWMFHAWFVAVEAAYRGLLFALCDGMPWALAMGLYGWWRRGWYSR